jgi:phage N-6-adenine-methyltransferase
MIKNKALYTSNTDNWETPANTFNELNKEFNFNLDVCASSDNAKCKKYFTKEINGLNQKWEGNCFMNPPYGKEIYKWIEKAYNSSLQGLTVVCLLPARTDTKWFHNYCIKGEIRFIKGRLKFGDSKNSAPFPSMIVIFRKKEAESWRLTTP